MRSTLTVLAACLIAMMFLAGCKGGGSSFGSFFGGDDIIVSGLPGDDGSGDPGSGDPGSGDPGSGDDGGTTHYPEPATIALLGSGLFAYAMYRRKKRK